ncbi:hypothetical protein [Lysobacter sp. CA199]|uniref:hypothetical protein n=1 Tax=Lysobacter sp. CA199 TaxID=3455608 RepID=UPI003F8D46DB
MNSPPDRVDTRDIAALLAATDDQGEVDPIAFEAERLILRNQRVGGIDAVALVDALQRLAPSENSNGSVSRQIADDVTQWQIDRRIGRRRRSRTATKSFAKGF